MKISCLRGVANPIVEIRPHDRCNVLTGIAYWIEHVTFGILYVMFTFPTTIFYRGLPGFATDCPFGVWCRGLTTCLLYVGPLFENLIQNYSRFVSLT